jgi:tetratricopeptide (TPR) repeat protein
VVALRWRLLYDFAAASGFMITSIFNLLALIYLFRGVQIARQIWVGRSEWQGGSFTQYEKRMAEQASFFLAVPVGVFFHELAHALAIWLFGGGVAEFGYRVFWGFVRPTADSVFTPQQNWFISLAGTIGSLAFGLVLWLILRQNPLPALRYFGLRAFRYQIFFSLVYYPIFTLIGFYGDWRIIYDNFRFDTTPVLSGLTLAVHVALLGWFFYVNRIGWFEMPTFDSFAEQERMRVLERNAAASPQDSKLQLQLIDLYRQHGEKNKARMHLRAFLKENPRSAQGYLQSAILKAQDKGQIPKGASEDAARALSLGLDNPAGIAYANRLQGEYSLGVGRLDQAIDFFDRGIESLAPAGQPALKARLYYSRAIAHRRKEQYKLAREDIGEAINLARSSGHGQAMSHYQAELAAIEQQDTQSKGLSRNDRFRQG